jgi:hypothetical protein
MSINSNATPSTGLLTKVATDAEYEDDKKKTRLKFVAFFIFIAVGIIICIVWAGSWSPDAELDDIYLRLTWLGDDSVKCNDGSPVAYYTRTPNLNNNWVVFLEYGGSYCWDQETCDSRVTSDEEYTTSNLLEMEKEEDGLLSTDPYINPFMWDWNIITIPYCSSDYWSGRATPDTSGTTYYFQGADIIDAVLDEVFELGLMDGAENILIGGQGAGGAGVLTQGDIILETFENNGFADVNIKGFLDTAWNANNTEHFVDPPTCTTASNCPPYYGIGYAVSLGTWQQRLPARCDNVEVATDCYMAGLSNLGDSNLPLLAFEWQYEVSQLASEGIPLLDLDDQDQVDFAESLNTIRWAEFDSLPSQSGYHYPQCYDHEIYTKHYLNVRGLVEDDSIAFTLNEFLMNDVVPSVGDNCGGIDCNPTCGMEEDSTASS